jgi:hypothetical protein
MKFKHKVGYCKIAHIYLEYKLITSTTVITEPITQILNPNKDGSADFLIVTFMRCVLKN